MDVLLLLLLFSPHIDQPTNQPTKRRIRPSRDFTPASAKVPTSAYMYVEWSIPTYRDSVRFQQGKEEKDEEIDYSVQGGVQELGFVVGWTFRATHCVICLGHLQERASKTKNRPSDYFSDHRFSVSTATQYGQGFSVSSPPQTTTSYLSSTHPRDGENISFFIHLPPKTRGS